MSQYWSTVTKGLIPYIPGEQPQIDNLVKLNTNENPYGPSPRVSDAIVQTASATLRLYPDPEATELKQTLSRHYRVRPDQVFVGNGSDEVLAHTFVALLKHERPLWMPDVTYSFYRVYCRLFGIECRLIPLTEDFRLRVDDYLPAGNDRAGAIIFANPNAPTGRGMSVSDIERIAAANSEAVVVIDEAYVDFGAESAIPLVERYPNLLVVQTFSKSRALAGLRVGFAIGSASLIDALERVKNSFNSYPLGRPAQAGAIASVEDDAYFQASCKKIMTTRNRLSDELAKLDFEVLPSQANFVFARHPKWEGALLASKLREKAVIVRHFPLPRIDPFLRITVGTDEECAVLIDALSNIINE